MASERVRAADRGAHLLAHIPMTVDELTVLAAGGEVVAVPAYLAVQTSGAGDEAESAEFDALCEAAAASVQRIVDTGGEPRRVVAAADVDAVRLDRSGELPLLDRVSRADLLAVYVDEDAATEDVARLVATTAGGEQPDEAQYDAVETRLLLWHHPSEIDQLTGRAGP